MKTLTEIRETLQTERPYLAEKYGVTVVGVFGSYVRVNKSLTATLIF
jgi:predicted nucleotidyltransferase